MLTRRQFIGAGLAGVLAGAGVGCDLKGAGQPAWPGPIGLELYTVRDQFAKDPAGTLKRVAAVGYKQVEIAPGLNPSTLKQDLRAAGLTAASGYFQAVPKDTDGWKKQVEQAHAYGLSYMVLGDNPKLTANEWRRRASLFNQFGRISKQAGIQFCYHNHFREFVSVDHTTGYDIMLAECDPNLLKMEMDIFWITYAGQDPLSYWKRFPGRFPLLHIKDLRKGITVHSQEDPSPKLNPFVPVGMGRIDWRRIFSHVHEAGAKHIFVEQDRCSMPEFKAIKISYDYLSHLRLS